MRLVRSGVMASRLTDQPAPSLAQELLCVAKIAKKKSLAAWLSGVRLCIKYGD